MSLDIRKELDAVNFRKHYLYKDLTEEEQKSFSPFVLMRYISNPDGDLDIQEWFIERTNEFVNKNHWDLSKNHKQLLWNACTHCGIGSPVRFTYLKAPTRKTKANKIEKLLLEMYPSAKLDDITYIASTMTKADKTKLFDDLGFDKKQRKEYE